MSAPLVSVIVLNYNGAQVLGECLDSVLGASYPSCEVILVDNASTDASLGDARRRFGNDPRLRVIENTENLFFCAGNNRGLTAARGAYCVVLNNDTVVERGWLEPIVDAMEHDPAIGACQPLIMTDKDRTRFDYAGADIDRFGFAFGRCAGEIDRGQCAGGGEIFYAGGTAMVLRRSVLKESGLFDERFGAHWEDVDLSWRIRLAGYRIVLVGGARVFHKGSVSMAQFVRRPKVAWYVRKNRLCGLLKNYGALRLAGALPVLVGLYAAASLKELLIERNPALAMSSVSALWWNLKELPRTLGERRRVQRCVRKVSDRTIVSRMRPGLMRCL